MLKNYKIGIDACRKAVLLDPNFQLAKNNLKWGLDELAKVNQSIQQIESISTSNWNQSNYLNLGLYYFQAGNYPKSISIWQNGLTIFPNASSDFLNNMGTSLVMNKQYSQAIEAFNKILAKDPNNQLAKNNISWAMSDSLSNK